MHATTHASATRAAAAAAAIPQETSADYLVYRAADRQYGAALRAVHELRRFDEIRSLDAAPACGGAIIGTIPVQGSDVPVIDLAALLEQPRPERDNDAEVVVLSSGGRLIAVAAECVIDVVTLVPSQMRMAPAIRAEDGAHYLAGIGRIGQRVLALLDVDKLILNLDPAKFAA